MEKTSNRTKSYALTLTVRCEYGRAELTLDIDALSKPERQFLFDVMRRTQEGGHVGFDLTESGPGEKRLMFLLREPVGIDKGVKAAIVQSNAN